MDAHDLPPLHTSDIALRTDSSYGDKQKYSQKLAESDLPENLKPLQNSLDWPTDMTAHPQPFLSCYFGEPNYQDPVDKHPHTGIDIQAKPLTTSIITPKNLDLSVVNVEDPYEHVGVGIGMVDVTLYDLIHNLMFLYVHLDKNSLITDLYSIIEQPVSGDRVIKGGTTIGTIGLYIEEMDPMVKVDPNVARVYGRSHHHLHFQLKEPSVSLSELRNDRFLSARQKNIDPLPLLKKLY